MASTRLSLHHDQPCPFCKRSMDCDDTERQPTRDHHPVPRSQGGTKTIVCCALCNNLKGDMTPAEWSTYMAENPGWWLYTTRERRQKRRRQREADRTDKWGPRRSNLQR